MHRFVLILLAFSFFSSSLRADPRAGELPSLLIKPPTIQGFDKAESDYLSLRLDKGLLVALTEWYSVRDTEIVSSSIEELEKLISNPSNSRDVLADIDRILNSDYIVTVDVRRNGQRAFISAALIDFSSGAPVERSVANIDECDPGNAEEVSFYSGEIARALHEPGYKPKSSPFKGGVTIRVDVGRLEELRVAPLSSVAPKTTLTATYRPDALPKVEKVVRLDSGPGRLPDIQVVRDAASALAQLIRGLDMLMADGDALLNGGELAKAEAMYVEVRKRAEGYTAYRKELHGYEVGAEGRIAIARKIGFQLRLKAADALAPESALDAYRGIRKDVAGTEAVYAPALAELGDLIASRISATRMALIKPIVDKGDELLATGDYEAAVRSYRSSIAAAREQGEEFNDLAGLTALLAGRLSSAHSGKIFADLAKCDALFSAGDLQKAASALRAVAAERNAAGSELNDSSAPFSPVIRASLDAVLRSSVALDVKRGDQALSRGDVTAALGAYADAERERAQAVGDLADPIALANLIAGRQITAARYAASVAKARADSFFIAGEFDKAKAEYGAALKSLELSPRYTLAKAKGASKVSEDERALLEDAAQDAAGIEKVSQTVLDIFRNQVLSYRDRLLVLDVRMVRDPALKAELRRTAAEAAIFIIRNPSGADATARTQFAEALKMVIGDPSLGSISLQGPCVFLPFEASIKLGERSIALPAESTLAPEGEAVAIVYKAALKPTATPGLANNPALELAAGFPVSYRSDGSISSAILATKAVLTPRLVASAGSPLLFHTNGRVAYFVGNGTAFFLDDAGKETFSCPLNVEKKLSTDLEVEAGADRRLFQKGSPLLVFGGGRYIAGYVRRPGVRTLLRAYAYAGPALGDEAFFEGGIFGTGLAGESSGQGTSNGIRSHELYLSPFWMQRTMVSVSELTSLVSFTDPSIHNVGDPAKCLFMKICEYANNLSLKDGLVPCYSISGGRATCNYSASGWRLPTEAEWEYAFVGSTTFSGVPNPGNEGAAGMHFDKHYLELCSDIFAEYGKSPAFDPRSTQASDDLAVRVVRQGVFRFATTINMSRAYCFRLARSSVPIPDKAIDARASSQRHEFGRLAPPQGRD